MTLRSPRRRMIVVGAGLLGAGGLTSPLSSRILQSLNPLWSDACRDESSTMCTLLTTWPSVLPLSVQILLLLVFFTASLWAVRWAVRPISDLATSVRNVGPQNLGYRVGVGRPGDEAAALAEAVNEMMGRIAVGYEAQRRFAANASHELRTPLAVQRTLIEVGFAQPLTPERLGVLTAQLLETNERNVRLIEALLVLSESDRGLVSRVPIRLDSLVAGVLSDHGVAAQRAQVTIESRLRPTVVLGEQVLLERLVTNLVQNAIKYNRPGGTIDVEMGERLALRIANTGDDVPPEAVGGLFEPFRRLSGRRIDHSGGAGLGLTIARSITQAHGGTISCFSSGSDGLRVDVSLPSA